MSLSSINSMQTTVADLKNIIDRNHASNTESTSAVKQMQLLLGELERRAEVRAADNLITPIGSVLPITL